MSYGTSQATTAQGSKVHVYYLGRYWILGGQPSGTSYSEWGDWALAVYDAGTRIGREQGLQEVLRPNDIQDGTPVTVKLFGPNGRVETLDITDALVQSYQEVEGFDAHPFYPNFDAMNDGELIDWAERGDGDLSFEDLKRVKPLYQDNLIDDEQLGVLIDEFIADLKAD